MVGEQVTARNFFIVQENSFVGEDILEIMYMKMSLKEKALFFRQMATMVQAGLPILGILEILKKMSPSAFKIVAAIEPPIRAGNSIAAAMESATGVFSIYEIEMVRAGEMGGMLEARLVDITEYLEKMSAIQAEFSSKMIYPFLLFNASFFIPPLYLLFTEGLRNYLVHSLVPLSSVYIVGLMMYGAYRIVSRNPAIAGKVDGMLLRIPILGRLIKSFVLSRLMRVLGDLYSGGVNPVTSLRLAARSCGNLSIAHAVEQASPLLDEGQSILVAITSARVLPPFLISFIASGEAAGMLPELLKKASVLLQNEFEERLKKLSVLLPFAIYLIMAIYAGYIIVKQVSGIYGPMFDILK